MWQTQLGHCIYQSPSGFRVYQNWFYRWLKFGRFDFQTVLARRAPHQAILNYLPALTLLAKREFGPTCLLGLGGAAVAHLLQSPLVAVEIDEEVIHIAKTFFMTDELKHLSIIHDNAFDFVSHSLEKFAHLLIDLSSETSYPEQCATNEFFIACKNRLSPNGFLAINLANKSIQWPILQNLKQVFGSTLVIPIKKCANLVIIASRADNPQQFLQRITHFKELKTLHWTERWGLVGHL